MFIMRVEQSICRPRDSNNRSFSLKARRDKNVSHYLFDKWLVIITFKTKLAQAVVLVLLSRENGNFFSSQCYAPVD